jgi:hypothetical protein
VPPADFQLHNSLFLASICQLSVSMMSIPMRSSVKEGARARMTILRLWMSKDWST